MQTNTLLSPLPLYWDIKLSASKSFKAGTRQIWKGKSSEHFWIAVTVLELSKSSLSFTENLPLALALIPDYLTSTAFIKIL